jgi:hypothetical protein
MKRCFHTKTLLSDSEKDLKEKGGWEGKRGFLDMCRTGIQSCVVKKENSQSMALQKSIIRIIRSAVLKDALSMSQNK